MGADFMPEVNEMGTTKVEEPSQMAHWRLNGIGLLRILFGIV
jgi:hypothetical protein